MPRNKNFEEALQWVKKNRANMVTALGSYPNRIELISYSKSPLDGRCYSSGLDPKTKTVVVQVVDRRHDIGRFINVIVHELTHVRQVRFSTREKEERGTVDPKREKEAEEEGWKAQQEYLKTRK